MKSKFAKFTDGTLGLALVFLAATAVLRYYTALDAAMFCAGSIAAAVAVLAKLKPKKKDMSLIPAAEDMFYEFMFLPPDAPAKLLYNGLKTKYPTVARHGEGVFANGKAAYFFSPGKSVPRLIAKAGHYGATSVLLLCKTPPECPQVTGLTVTPIVGNDAYNLLLSLNALPPDNYAKARPHKPKRFDGALDKDKIPRYAVLAASLAALSWLTRSIVAFVCACICAALAAIAIVMLALRSVKNAGSKE